MKIVVAIPVYDGKLPVQVVSCLLDERAIAIGLGDDISFRFLPSCSHPAMGRNQLAQEFMNSDADRLFFLDADVTFEPGSLVRLAHLPHDFVGGAYRYKHEKEEYPVSWIDHPELWTDEYGLLEVRTLPGGFLSLSRKVFEVLKEAHPKRGYYHFGKLAHSWFHMPILDGVPCGEDSFFCKEWRDTGGKVFLDPDLTLTHWDGNVPYKGHIGQWLKRNTSQIAAS